MSTRQKTLKFVLFIYLTVITLSTCGGGSGGTTSDTLYTSTDLTGHGVISENVGGCDVLTTDSSVTTVTGQYGIVTSNPNKNKTYVNALGAKKFTTNFPNSIPITLGIYKYSYQIKLPV